METKTDTELSHLIDNLKITTPTIEVQRNQEPTNWYLPIAVIVMEISKTVEVYNFIMGSFEHMGGLYQQLSIASSSASNMEYEGSIAGLMVQPNFDTINKTTTYRHTLSSAYDILSYCGHQLFYDFLYQRLGAQPDKTQTDTYVDDYLEHLELFLTDDRDDYYDNNYKGGCLL